MVSIRSKIKKWKKKKEARKAPGALYPAVVLPPLGVYNILWALKIQALACVAKDASSICLAKRKLGSGASDRVINEHEKQKGVTKPVLTAW